MIGYTIKELHKKIKNQEISVETIAHETLLDCKAAQKKINAIVTINEEMTSIAKELDKQQANHYLFGIPYGLKDNFSTKGILTTASSKILSNYVPFFDATVVSKLKETRALLACKTSLDELGMGGTNKTALTGPVLNPWDLTRISGGSSGGSAALVASGVVPFALGSDTGDSIRKPAAYCGIVGMKPTYGLISRYGVIPYASSLDHVGAFTRSVEDMAIVINELSGFDPLDFTSLDLEKVDYLSQLSDDLSGKKIAILKNVLDAISDKTIHEHIEKVKDILESKGAIVEFVSLNQDLLRAILPVYSIIANAEATANHASLDGIRFGLRAPGENLNEIMIHSRTEGLSASIRKRYITGSYALATENQEYVFKKAKRVRRLITQEMDRVMKSYDALIAPAAPSVAPKVEVNGSSDHLSDYNLVAENHLALGNFTGMPSITIPCGFIDELPIGVNITTNHLHEQEALNIAYAIENKLGLKNQFARVV